MGILGHSHLLPLPGSPPLPPFLLNSAIPFKEYFLGMAVSWAQCQVLGTRGDSGKLRVV